MKIAGFSQRVSCFSETKFIFGINWSILILFDEFEDLLALPGALLNILSSDLRGSMLRLISHQVGHKLVVKSTKASIDVGLTR